MLKTKHQTHSEDVILQNIKNLKPASYNKFYWWRTFKSDEIPIKKKSPIEDKIKAGYYNFPNHYFWAAQLSLLEMNKEQDRLGSYDKMIELHGKKKNRYKRLMEDFYKEEQIKLERIFEDFTEEYTLKKDKAKEIIENFDGTIEELYQLFEKKYKYTFGKSWSRTF